MKAAQVSLLTVLVMASLTANAFAQAFPNDNDGLLDVGETPGFPANPAAATGDLYLGGQGIQDLDGASLLTNLQSLNLKRNQITTIDPGDFAGLPNLQSLNLWVNRITSLEAGDFNGLTNLKSLGLGQNSIRNIEAGVFDGLTNLEGLSLSSEPNYDLNIEANAFKGLKELRSLVLGLGQLTELNLSGATFDNLQPGVRLSLNGYEGFVVFGNRIDSLILDGAELSLGSFNAIIRTIAEGEGRLDGSPGNSPSPLEHISLVNLTFSDEIPSDLSSILNIPTLDNVRIDPDLFNLYAAELQAFAALPGNTVTIVPEPTGLVALLILAVGAVVNARRRRHTSDSGVP